MGNLSQERHNHPESSEARSTQALCRGPLRPNRSFPELKNGGWLTLVSPGRGRVEGETPCRSLGRARRGTVRSSPGLGVKWPRLGQGCGNHKSPTPRTNGLISVTHTKDRGSAKVRAKGQTTGEWSPSGIQQGERKMLTKDTSQEGSIPERKDKASAKA